MKKNTFLKAVLAMATASLLMALPACKKSSDQQQPPSKRQLITKGIWKIAKVEQKDAAGNWVNITNSMGACELDNLLAFGLSLTYESNEGATKCDAGDPQIIETGTWKFENNDTQVSFTATGSQTADLADIVEITSESLVFTKIYTGNGNTYHYRVSYSH